MKKITLIVAVAAFGLSVSSCKKNYKCSCTFKEEHDGHTHDESVYYNINKTKKKDAEALCNTYHTTLSADEHNTEVKCDLN
ncbi:MAG: hypothetical protein ACK4K0_08540 [Flavobacteriales bacterium]